MPGLNQLKKFSEDMLNVGDEVKIRAQRGEKAVTVPIPQNITVEDDSDEFVLGLPTKEETVEEKKPTDLEKNSVDINLEDIDTIDELDDTDVASSADADSDIPSLDDLFGGGATDDDDLDLSEFEDVPVKKEVSLDEMSLDDLLAGGGSDDIETIPDFEEETETSEPEAEVEVAPEPEAEVEAVPGPEVEDLSEIAPEPIAEAEPEASAEDLSGLDSFEMPDISGMDFSEAMPAETESEIEPEIEGGAETEVALEAEVDSGIETPTDVGSEDEAEKEEIAEMISEGSNEDGSFDAPPVEGLDAPDFGADLDSLLGGMEQLVDNVGSEPAPTEDFSTEGLDAPTEDFSTEGLDTPIEDFSTEGLDAPTDDFSTEGLDAPEGGEDAGAEAPSDGSSGIDASLEVPDFDADSFLDGMGIGGGDDDERPVTFDEGDLPKMETSDFEMSSEEEMEDESVKDFVIPGFSDTTTAKAEKKGHARFGAVSSEDKPKNTFTDEEYVVFKKNFATYPLNLRIALEQFVVSDEFNDDVVFEILEKIYKKAPARQVASALEKWTDVPIAVPRDYERRSVAEYEAYKQSFQYQLKNRIIPGAIAALVLGFLGYSIFILSNYFIYRPAKASSLYKQGYALLQQNEYPQSEIQFAAATSYRPKQKWFFKYAEGYRDHKQYDRAGKIYKSAMFYFGNKKQIVKKAGLDWATMELYDLANYQEAERIVKREVLDKDKLTNDPDGILLLGDIFLEWADVDSEKFENAREQYSNLINLYGSTDLYMSRMMRYFIRLDNANSLRRVLELKARFYPNKKSLSGNDWIELSGYLLEKLYGPLRPSEEPLRPQIEDLREMLERGTTFAPKNPVGHYNLAQYYENTENFPAAKAEFKYSLDLFDAAPTRNKKNTYREINAHRHLGELYSREREFLLAQEIYTNGINLYQREARTNGLTGNSDIGMLYADLGDIDYFVSGDMDAALHNYTASIETFNDNALLRYKVGNIHYSKHDYSHALGSFIKASETRPNDMNLLLALGNTLSLRDDNFASLAYYDELMEKLDFERAKRDLLIPETNAKDANLLDMYIKGCNNIGVVQYKIAKQTGNSQLNAKALVNFSNSIRAYDALTRDKKTMIRSQGSNLAAQNSQYITHPTPSFEPALYTDIPRTLVGEKGLY